MQLDCQDDAHHAVTLLRQVDLAMNLCDSCLVTCRAAVLRQLSEGQLSVSYAPGTDACLLGPYPAYFPTCTSHIMLVVLVCFWTAGYASAEFYAEGF